MFKGNFVTKIYKGNLTTDKFRGNLVFDTFKGNLKERSDYVVPVFVSAEIGNIDDTTLAMLFDKLLSEGVTPATTDFVVVFSGDTFVITVDTTKAGSASDTFVLPTYEAGYDCSIAWGDGITTTHSGSPGNISHTYPAAGIYQIAVSGTFPRIYFNNVGDKLKAISVDSWGLVGWTTFYRSFYGCANLASINGGKLSGEGISTSGFYYAFYGCGITSLPVDLFRYCVNVSTLGFYATFSGCPLTSLPVDLFRYNVNVSTLGFERTFSGCPLTSLPVDLFRYCVNVSTYGFNSTFRDCPLTSLPVDLFRYNVNVSTGGFNFTFYGCTKLQLNRNIFYADGEQGTRFLNKTASFVQCFDRSSFTGTQGEAPDLWNCDFGTGTLTKTDCFNGAGNSLTSISNYGDIPAEWI